MLTYSNIATIINNQIMKNATGENSGVIIAEDLSNLVEVAKVVDANNAMDMKNALGNIIVGIHNFVLTREIKTSKFKLFRDAVAYGGGIQRIMMTDFYEAKDTDYHNLVNGTDYTDGHFYGSNPSAVVIEGTKDFKVPVSYSQDFFSTWFTNASELSKWANLIAIKEKNTIKKELAELEKRIIVRMATECYDGNRVIHFLTEFNNLEGRTVAPTSSAPATLTNNVKWTLAELSKYRDEFAYFASFCKETIDLLCGYVEDPNKKYNDGSIIAYSPSELTTVALVNKFAKDIKYLANPVEFNPEKGLDYMTFNAWQSTTNAMLPSYDVVGKIVKKGSGEVSDTTYENIVGIIYDVEGAGITTVDDSVTVKEVPEEKFNTTFHFLSNKYYIDKRLSAVVLALD